MVLRTACERRGIEYRDIEARDFDFDPTQRLPAGDLLYRPATSLAAMRVEQFLFAPGVATFYAGSDDRVFFVGTSQPIAFERAGIRVPTTVYCASPDRDLLDQLAQRLGGYPLLAKMGGQAGAGVVFLESYRALYSFVDYALSLNHPPMLSAFIATTRQWRVIVVGERCVAANELIFRHGDFRAVGHGGSFTIEPPGAVAAAAVAAVRATRLEFGGVDVLETADAAYVLESNFPCFFPEAELLAGIDVSGAMVDHLIRKADAFEAVIDR
jgi:glutathione synthase/RimK-type ligase-like ATP-grasp enzyme